MIVARVVLIVLLSVTPALAKGSVKECASTPKPRDRAYCLLQTDDRAAIPRLLELARDLAAKDPKLSIGAAEDFFYAAENAGVIAAKTSAEDLLKLRGDDAATQLFAMRSLGHMLSILRMGYAKGGDADAKTLVERRPVVAKACLARFGSRDDRVLSEAARCVGQTNDGAYAADLVKVAVDAASPSVKRDAIAALRELDQLPGKVATLRPLVALLSAPLPEHWTSDEVMLKSDVCQVLGGLVSEADTWAREPARAAVREIGDKHSQAKEACANLVTRAGGTLSASETPAANATNWYWEHDLSKCRVTKFGTTSLEFCALSSPAGDQARTFSITFRDPSKLDIPEKHGRRDPHDGEHHLVHRLDVPATAGEYMLYDATAPFELSATAYLIFVPIAKGTPDKYTALRTQLYLFDTTTQRSKLVWESPACDGCQNPTIQLSYKPPSPTKQISLIQHRNGQTQTTKLTWDGTALRP